MQNQTAFFRVILAFFFAKDMQILSKLKGCFFAILILTLTQEKKSTKSESVRRVRTS